jgi:superfamily I DNA/RNA helicase
MTLLELMKRAQDGNSESQYLVGKAHDEGKITNRNLLEAIAWYQKAANQGHPLALKALGLDEISLTKVSETSIEHRVTKIYGPPGTGKTTTLIRLIQDAITAGVEPDQIGFFSFTNKATEEAKSRMVTDFPQFDIDVDFPYFQTIHSLANNALRTKVTVISEQQAKKFDSDVKIERPFMREGDETSQVVRIKHPVLDAATTARSLKVSFKSYLENLPSTQRWPINKWLGIPFKMTSYAISESGIDLCIKYNNKYETYKKNLDVIDFADMLDKAIINKMSLPELKLLLIDEAQDLSPTQWDIADVLINKAEKTYIAGDDDQAICESFGASAKHFLEASGHEIVLKKSGRIPPVVHQHLSNLITKLQLQNPFRKEKIWEPKDEGVSGEVYFFENSAFFQKFLTDGIKHKTIKDVLLMFVTNSSLKSFSAILESNEISHYAANELVGSGTPTIRLLTIWGAKGGQAETTALITTTDMDLRMLQEDPRLEYVAHSRAKNSFYYVGRFTGQGVLQHSADKAPQNQSLKISLNKPTNTSSEIIEGIQPSVRPKTLEEFSAMFNKKKSSSADK